MLGKNHAMADRIREMQRKCGVKMLPVVRHERKLWFLDERLRQPGTFGTPMTSST